MTMGKAYYKACSTRLGYLLARSTWRVLRKIGLLSKPCMPLDALSLDYPSARGLMQLWQRIHWSSGDGMMPPEDLLAIYNLACSWPVPGDIVELGAWVGLTTSYLATSCRVRGTGRVHAVDTFEGTKEDGDRYASIARFQGSTLQAFRKQIAQADVTDLVQPLVALTTEAAKLYRGAAIRLLLVDADHSYEGVRADFETWSPLVAPGGLIVFHDYHMPGVARFVDENLRRHSEFAYAPGLVQPRVVAVTKRATRPKSAAVMTPLSQSHAASPCAFPALSQ